MPLNLLLIPLLAGYAFLHLCYVTRFRAYGVTGYRILLEAAAAGLVFLIAAHGIVTGIARHFENGLLPWVHAWREVAPFPYTASAFGSVLVAAVAVAALNLVGKQSANKRVTRRYGDEMMNMLRDAFYAVQPVMPTTTTGKVYVGLLDKALTLNPHMPYVSLLPTLSGYRD